MIRIGIVGFGGVGKAFLKLLADKKDYLKREGLDLRVYYVINRGGGVYNPEGIDGLDLIDFCNAGGSVCSYPKGGSKEVNYRSMLGRMDIDLMVEMTCTNMDTGEPGMTHIMEALKGGIHVVTSNKGPVMLGYRRLKEVAASRGVQLAIGCTTGGALPSINAGLIDMVGSDILSIEGVVNGTTNFILGEMEERGVTYKAALEKAKEMGIAEANPSLDVEGWDTASKILILTNVLMNENKTMEDICVEGITDLTPEMIRRAKSSGTRYKLVGRAWRVDGQLKLTVKPEEFGMDHPFYSVNGRNKAVRYTSDMLGDLLIAGGASGVLPAAASVLRDIINIYRGISF